MRRTAVGIDLGTTDVIAANVGRKGVDIVQNSVSERRTPALVSFTDRRRLLGDAALAQVRSNCGNSCRGLKHLVGRQWEAPEVDLEKFWSLSKLGRADAGDAGYVVSYKGKDQCVSATVCFSMLMTSIIAICKAWTQMDVKDVVLAIPSYFTARMRRACLDALHIAGINCLRLLHESTALALAWRFESRNFEDTNPVVVALCSAGHSGILVAVARFYAGAVAVLGEAYDRSVSGRAMDRAIIDRFVKSLRGQGAPDPLGSAKALLKLEEAAKKVKKTLSVSEVARGTAECVVEDYDLSCDIQKADFEADCSPMFPKLAAAVERAMSAAGMDLKDLQHVEIVGGCSRVPWVQRQVKEAFGGRELSTTLNADEAVARGCAWQAAMSSPHIRLNQIPLQESGSLPVFLEWQDSDGVGAEGAAPAPGAAGRTRVAALPTEAGPGCDADVALSCKGPLELSAVEIGEEGEAVVGTWRFPTLKKGPHSLLVTSALDAHGIFTVEKGVACDAAAANSATKDVVADADEAQEAAKEPKGPEGCAEELSAPSEQEADAAGAGAPDAVSAPAEKSAAEDPVDVGAAVSDSAAAVPAPDAACVPEDADGEPASDQAKGAPASWFKPWQWRFRRSSTAASADDNAQGEPEASVGPVAGKAGGKKARKKAVAADKPATMKVMPAPSDLGYSAAVLEKARRAELEYQAADEAAIQAERHRNDFEAYMFDLQDKVRLGCKLLDEFASPDERSALPAQLQEAEDWASDHTAEEAPVYAERLKQLRRLETECGTRQATLSALQEKVKALQGSMKRYKASAIHPHYDFIAKEKLDQITAECDKNEQWLAQQEALHKDSKKWDPPVLSATELAARNKTLVTMATAILSEVRPKKEQETNPVAAGAGQAADAANSADSPATPPPPTALGRCRRGFFSAAYWLGVAFVASCAGYLVGEAFGVEWPQPAVVASWAGLDPVALGLGLALDDGMVAEDGTAADAEGDAEDDDVDAEASSGAGDDAGSEL